MSIGMIILAAGFGERMGRPLPKQYALHGRKPIIMHTLEKAEKLDAVGAVVITCPPQYLDETRALLENHRLHKEFSCIEGGATRQASVLEGLRVLPDYDTVIIHEAVRPFVPLEEFEALIASEHANAIYGAPIPFTVLEGHGEVEGLLSRQDLINVQLPQKFDRKKLLDAHERAAAEGREYTEDASLLFDISDEHIAVLDGSDLNIKITHPADMIIGEAIYEQYVLGKD
jgi:2-C-methyl-D-erythritol 4-phosphate cytidylyltransferase